MSSIKKILALLLALCMVVALAACGSQPAPAPAQAPAAQPEEQAEPAPEAVAEPNDKLVYATSTFGQKFSPFFATTAYDMEVVDLTQGGLLAADRGGAIIYNGIEGETHNYNGTDYTYYGMGNVEVIQNDDGSVDYNLTMRDDIKFSDGTPADIDDVIFGVYVMCDPTYDGSSTLYALPIEGMAEYRAGMNTLFNLLVEAGEDNTDFSLWDEATQTAFWESLNGAGNAFAQEIIDYVNTAYAADDYVQGYFNPDLTLADVQASTSLQTAFGMSLWGFGDYDETGAFVDSLGNAYDLTVDEIDSQTYWENLTGSYDWDLVSMSDTESAGSSLFDLMEDYADYARGVSVGDGAANITGIIRTGDYSMTVHMTSFDATAIYNVGFYIAPLHYYGDEAAYDYDNNQFGFTKGDLSGVKAKSTQPLGCGPYVFQGYGNGVVTLTANEYYFQGEPVTKTILMQESVDSDYVPGIVTGTFDMAVPSISDDVLAAIKDANSNNEIVGDTVTTYLVDYRGYGYLGINADLVNTGDPASDASKALRKGFMTLFSVYRDTVINSYYGDRAAVIQYPISNTSWAAPKPADEGYQNAYSVDVDGNPIYDASMSDEQKYEAAKIAAIGYFKAAGFTFDEAAGVFTDVTETYEIMIPGQGQQDHPAYGIAVAASEVLATLGIKLQVNDVGTSTWNNALESNTAMMWVAAWQSTVDPDMTQVYRSNNAHGLGTNSNHYSVDDEALDELIDAGRASADTEYRKSVYKQAMEIIMDWGCELPLYQRKDCTTASSIRVDNETMPKDMTPYWGWYAQIEELAVQ